MDINKPHLGYKNQTEYDINCSTCKKWWSIPREDYPEDSKRAMYCTWCGTYNQVVRNN
jgi:hypothetical protein